MTDGSRLKTSIGIYDIHVRIDHTHKRWAIVVMPCNFKVDNYYHGVHVHPDRTVIPIKDMNTIYNIIYTHIKREGTLKEEKLRKELGL